jgi:hypothetical protein
MVPCGSGHGSAASFGKHNNEYSCSIKDEERFDQLNNC